MSYSFYKYPKEYEEESNEHQLMIFQNLLKFPSKYDYKNHTFEFPMTKQETTEFLDCRKQPKPTNFKKEFFHKKYG